MEGEEGGAWVSDQQGERHTEETKKREENRSWHGWRDEHMKELHNGGRCIMRPHSEPCRRCMRCHDPM